MVDPPGKGQGVTLSNEQRQELDDIATELAALARSGPALPGSIAERLTRCGHEHCGCHADPPRRHGPYFHWTRKVANKTVGRWLSAEQAADYRRWVQADRRLRELLGRLESIGVEALEADPRFER
jgi:N-acetyl-anhydromuramyl-L-alanine amidase AmpD